MDYLKKSHIGALIVIERDNSLTEYIEKAKKIYADISSDLLISLFFPNNPMHDGGIIIQGDKITCAGAVFPTSESLKISKRLGTRHRAALGISEETVLIPYGQLFYEDGTYNEYYGYPDSALWEKEQAETLWEGGAAPDPTPAGSEEALTTVAGVTAVHSAG